MGLCRDSDLAAFWPRETIPDTYMTHQANFALPKSGITHWWKMFNPQLLAHALLLKSVTEEQDETFGFRQLEPCSNI